MIYCVMRKYPDNLPQPHLCRPMPIACRRCFLLRKWADGGSYSAETSACIHVPLACHSRGNLFRFQFNLFGTCAPSVCLLPWNVFSFQLCFFGHAHPFRLSLALKFTQISTILFWAFTSSLLGTRAEIYSDFKYFYSWHSRSLRLSLALKSIKVPTIWFHCIHAYITFEHSHVQTCVHTCMQTDRQTDTHSDLTKDIPRDTHTRAYTYTHACMHANVDTHTHILMHSNCRHTHTSETYRSVSHFLSRSHSPALSLSLDI